jgi:hypothetical protein
MLSKLKNLIIQNFTLDKLRILIYSVGGRRFIMSMLVQLTASLLMWYAKITPETYRDIVIGTSGIFIAGNTFQKTRTPAPTKGD